MITLKHHPELFLWTLADESDQPKFQPSTPMPDRYLHRKHNTLAIISNFHAKILYVL